MLNMELPKEKVPAVVEDPKFLILFGKQKSGKTTILADLPDNLIIDLEEGSDYVEAMKIKVNSFEELIQVKQALEDKFKEAGKKPYKRISLDTASALEETVLPYAKMLYQKTPMGKNFKGDDVTKLPNGAGYLYIREAYKKIIDAFTKFCDTLILSGHVVDKQIEKDGKETTELDIALTGRLKGIIGAKADAIGYVYRVKNKTMITFKGGEDSISEARPRHLSNTIVTIAESEGEGENMTITTHWDKVFKNL